MRVCEFIRTRLYRGSRLCTLLQFQLVRQIHYRGLLVMKSPRRDREPLGCQ